MTDPVYDPDTERNVLMKRIDGKLAWICFFLILITLNTCSLKNRVGDAISDMRDGNAPAETAAPEVATPSAVTPETAPAPTAPAT